MPELTPVRSAAELRPRMVILVRDCRLCGQSHAHALVKLLPSGCWATCGEFHGRGGASLDVEPAISEGRMFYFDPGSGLEEKALEDAVGAALIRWRK